MKSMGTLASGIYHLKVPGEITCLCPKGRLSRGRAPASDTCILDVEVSKCDSCHRGRPTRWSLQLVRLLHMRKIKDLSNYPTHLKALDSVSTISLAIQL